MLWNKKETKRCGFGDFRQCPNLDSIWTYQKNLEDSDVIEALTNESGDPARTTRAVEELVSEIILMLPKGK